MWIELQKIYSYKYIHCPIVFTIKYSSNFYLFLWEILTYMRSEFWRKWFRSKKSEQSDRQIWTEWNIHRKDVIKHNYGIKCCGIFNNFIYITFRNTTTIFSKYWYYCYKIPFTNLIGVFAINYYIFGVYSFQRYLGNGNSKCS